MTLKSIILEFSSIMYLTLASRASRPQDFTRPFFFLADFVFSERDSHLLDTFFDQRSRELIEYLTKRGYNRTSLQRDANRVRSIPRHATLQPQEQKSAKTDRTSFVTSFDPALPKISSIVNKYTSLLQATANCKKAFPNPPVIAYRHYASLRDLLVHLNLSHENSSSQQPAGIKKCNHPRCLTCSIL